jgi:hypothetical protein
VARSKNQDASFGVVTSGRLIIRAWSQTIAATYERIKKRMAAKYDRTVDFRFNDGSTYKSFNGKEYNSIEQIWVLILGFPNSMVVGLTIGNVGEVI